MTEITLVVPDENCKGCDFLMNTSYDYQERLYCRIFQLRIDEYKKCLSCKLLSTKKGE